MKLIKGLVLLLATLSELSLAAGVDSADVSFRLTKVQPGSTYTVGMEGVSVVSPLTVTPVDADASAEKTDDAIVIKTAASFGKTSGSNALEITFQIEPIERAESNAGITAEFPGDAKLEVDGILFLAPASNKIPIKTLKIQRQLPPSCLAAPTCNPSNPSANKGCTADTKCYLCGSYCSKPTWVCCRQSPLP